VAWGRQRDERCLEVCVRKEALP